MTIEEEEEAVLCPPRVGHLLKAAQETFPQPFSQAYNKKALDEQASFGVLQHSKTNPDTDICANCRIKWIPGWSVSVKIEFLTTKRKKQVRNLVYKCDKCSYKLRYALPAPGEPRIKRVVVPKTKNEPKISKPVAKPGSKFSKNSSSSKSGLKAMLELKKQQEQKSGLNLMDFMN